jgi:hypothetical protein
MFRRSLICLFLCAGFASASLLDDFELKPKKIKFTKNNQEIFPEIELRPQEILAGVIKEPRYRSRAPQKFMASFGEEGSELRIPFVVDEKRAGKGYATLYIGTRGAGDLTKAKKATGKPALRGSQFEDTLFPPFQVDLPLEDGTTEAYMVQARISVRLGPPGSTEPDDSTLYLTALTVMEGKVQFGEESKKLLAFDANCNGIFGEKGAPSRGGAQARGDKLWIGTGSPKLEEAYIEAVPFGRFVLVEGEYYELEFNQNNGVSIAAADVPLGTINVSNPGFLLELVEGSDVLCVSNEREQEMGIPTGDYRVSVPGFRQKHRSATWELEGKRNSCEAKFEIKEGATTELALGPPLRVDINAVVKKVRSAYTLYLDFKLEGMTGEEYLYLRKNGRKVNLPEIIIKNSRGKVVKKGRFEYG